MRRIADRLRPTRLDDRDVREIGQVRERVDGDRAGERPVAGDQRRLAIRPLQSPRIGSGDATPPVGVTPPAVGAAPAPADVGVARSRRTTG